MDYRRWRKSSVSIMKLSLAQWKAQAVCWSLERHTRKTKDVAMHTSMLSKVLEVASSLVQGMGTCSISFQMATSKDGALGNGDLILSLPSHQSRLQKVLLHQSRPQRRKAGVEAEAHQTQTIVRLVQSRAVPPVAGGGATKDDGASLGIGIRRDTSADADLGIGPPTRHGQLHR